MDCANADDGERLGGVGLEIDGVDWALLFSISFPHQFSVLTGFSLQQWIDDEGGDGDGHEAAAWLNTAAVVGEDNGTGSEERRD